MDLLEVTQSTVEVLARFRCVGCGYGATSRAAPERCPMCGGHLWGREESRRLARLSQDLDQPLTREAEL
jgi:rubredoxin